MNLSYKKLRCGAIVTIFGLLLIMPNVSWGIINIPLTVQEALPSSINGIGRTAEPVTVGIPLAEDSGITSVNQLGLTGATKGQFRTLARWPNGNIKWVLADFPATVTAGGTNSAISLGNGSGNFGGSDLATDGTTISVNTGVAQFTIKKAGFNIFNSVVVNGTTLVSSASIGQGLLMMDSSGNPFSSTNDSSSTSVIEENGPVRAVIRADGSFKNGLGTRLMDYSIRLHFYAGKSYVKAYVTLRNASKNYPAHVLFNSMEAVVPITLGASKTVEFAKKVGTVTASLGSGETAYLFQDYSTDKLGYYTTDCYNWDPPVAGSCVNDTYTYDSSKAGLEIKIGSTTYNSLGNSTDWTQGWGEYRDSSGNGLTITSRWMSSYWPSGFEFNDAGTARIELFSKRNTKTGLKLLWGKHETREILWDFHTQSVNNQSVLYNLQYPLVARADFSHYQNTKAIYGQSEFVTAQQQSDWFTAQGKSTPSLNNLSPVVYRMWPWSIGGGDNQTDFPLNDLMDFLRTGNGGFYLAGEQRTTFNNDAAVTHSDDFVTDILSPTDPDPTKGSMNGPFFDMEHAHMSSLPIYYYLSGNEDIKNGVLDYGEYLSRTQVSGYYPLPTMSYFRAWSRKYRNFALIYEFTCYVATCNSGYQTEISNDTDYLLNSRDNPPLGVSSPRGRNLDRGYLYWDSDVSSTSQQSSCPVDCRVVHSLFHPQIHFEAVWQILRIMGDTGWNYARKEELGDYLVGLARFFFDEYYREFNGGLVTGDFGFAYNYPIDQTYTPNTNWSTNTIPYDASRAAVYGYQKTGDATFLTKANKLLWSITEYATSRSPSELQDQALMYMYFNTPSLIWKPLTISAQNNGGGSYTLSWTVPNGATQYQIKYSDKPIVEWLGFSQITRTYVYDPANNSPFFAANNVSDEPVPLSSGTQQYTKTGLDPAKTWHFSMKYLGPLDTTVPSAPMGLKVK